jgi:hypothetical protein
LDAVASDNQPLAKYYLSEESIPFAKIRVDDLETQNQRIWFVEDMTSLQKFPELHNWLSQNAKLVSIHDVTFQARNFSMRVYFYDPMKGLNAERAEDAKK